MTSKELRLGIWGFSMVSEFHTVNNLLASHEYTRAQLETVTDSKATLLTIVAINGDVSMAKLLVELGLEIKRNSEDGHGFHPLHYASLFANGAVVG